MTAYGTVESAVDAMKAGASDYVLKPFSLAELVLVIRKELATHHLRQENRDLREALGRRYEYKNIVARSDKMQAVLVAGRTRRADERDRACSAVKAAWARISSRAPSTNIPSAPPARSSRSTAPPSPKICSKANSSATRKAPFPAPRRRKPGKFELADKGTLFLDEIGDVPAAIQVKLLRVLQEREFERLGGTKTLKVDVRLVAATNRDLRAALEEGTFREDLYYRLNVVAIDIPPLRDHKEDIPALAEFFLQKFARESGKAVQGITPQAMKLLMDFHWPGNVRELQNVLERGVTLSSGATARCRRHSSRYAAHRGRLRRSHVLPEGMTLDQWEEEMIREALRHANGNKSQAARALGLSRNALRYRLSKMGVADPPEKDG